MKVEWNAKTIHSLDDVVSFFDGILGRWLRRMIAEHMIFRIDLDQIKNDSLLELHGELQPKDWRAMEYSEVEQICRTITKHQVLNSIKFGRRLKRDITRICGSFDSEHISDYRHGCDPERDYDDTDCIEVIDQRLPPEQRQVRELNGLGWNTEQIALELSVTNRTIQNRNASIQKVTLNEFEKNERPRSQRV